MSDACSIADNLDALGDWLWPAARELPAPVVQRVQRLWLDTASCAWSGLHADEPARWVALQAAGDAGAVALPGSDVRLAASAATTSLAVAACWDEACEGLALAHGRPGVPVVAALWTQLAQRPMDWRALWQATAVGYEVAARLGARLRIRPGMHVDGVWSAFGAAAAVVHAQGGNWACARRALEACAAQLPFSLVRPAREGANIRNLYLGHSAWLGLQAAQAALAGFAVAEGCIDEVADLALDPAQAGAWPPAGQWLLLQSYWKPFAAVRHVHYGAQAALDLRSVLPAGELPDALHLTVYPEALQYCSNRAPRTPLAAQFSLSHGVAAAWVHGDLSPAEYRAPRFMNDAVRTLEQRVTLTADAQAFPGSTRGARLEARRGAQSWRIEQGPVTGDAGLQPDAAAVLAKYRQLTQADPAMAHWAQRLLGDPIHLQARLPTPGA